MTAWDRRLGVFCLIGGLAFIFIGASIYIVEQSLTQSASFSLLAGLVLLITYVILGPTAALELVRSPQARYGTLSIAISAGVVGALVLANALASKTTASADLTRFHLNTLAPRTEVAVRKLDSDLTIVAFYGKSDAGLQDLRTLLDSYRSISPRVKPSFEDPFVQGYAEHARQLGVLAADTVVLQYHDRSQSLAPGSQSEQDITAAILKLESDRSPVVCWAVGEGERDLASSDQVLGYSEAKAQMTGDNLTVKELLLNEAASIPTECDAVAIIGPSRSLGQNASTVLAAFLKGGGRAVIALDPFSDKGELQSFNDVLKPYGVTFDGGLIVDPDPAHAARGDSTVLAATTYGSSPITRGLQNRATFFPGATAITPATDAASPPTGLVRSSDRSYEAMSMRSDYTARSGGDRSGPFGVMDTLDGSTASAHTRLVLIGTSGFAENAILNSSVYNSQLLTGSLDWLTDRSDLISIPAKPSRTPSFGMISQQETAINVFVVLVALPGLFILGGLIVWIRRRSG